MNAAAIAAIAAASAGALAVSLVASAHAVLQKRDLRAAMGWVAVIWLAPFFGAALYLVLGVNRIRRRAAALKEASPPPVSKRAPASPTRATLGEGHAHLDHLANLVERVTARPLLGGNRIEPLIDGDAAYPAMLAAIGAAERSIALATFIFDNDVVGRRFIDALASARERGVEVRVLIDAAGARYTRPSVVGALERRGVRVERFLPFRVMRQSRFFNLRNHRKLLIVDGRVGFTGGMNIRHGHLIGDAPAHPVHDTHFRVAGPVLAQLSEVFVEDWAFTCGETLAGDSWHASAVAGDPTGSTAARAIADGPDEDLDKCRWTILGALGCAKRSVTIATPYFLPDATLITALNVAAMRGVAVDILIPSRVNIRVAEWACWAQLWQMLERGCRVWLTPEPFDHTKLMLVDDAWVMLGSANLDPRSLRLNFELNVECYDLALATEVGAHLAQKRAASRELTLAEVDARPLVVRLRDGIARLFMPYL